MVGAVPPMLGSFTQWVGDNVDHNVASIDGRGSFHGMGIIACSNCHGTDCNNVEQVLDMNDTCSDEDVDDILYMDI